MRDPLTRAARDLFLEGEAYEKTLFPRSSFPKGEMYDKALALQSPLPEEEGQGEGREQLP
jgi:hypothetical protein